MKTKFVTVLFAGFFLLCSAAFSAPIIADTNWPKVFAVQFEQKGTSVILKWKADAEPKEIYYIIETSTDAVSYKQAAIVLGGFAEEQEFSYLFKTKYNEGSKTYFRIKQINQDGSYRIVSEQSF